MNGIVSAETKTNRNFGVDLLKMVSMVGIVMLHILGHGGILEESKPFTVPHYSAWFLEVSVYSSVNCYALISGYVNYRRQHKFSNILYLLLQVMFYSCTITVAFMIIDNNNVKAMDVLKAIFPYAYGTYWYFSAYFCLFFFMPYLDEMLTLLSKQTLMKLIGTMTVLFSVLPTLFHYDFPKINIGYSFLWLLFLYMLGGIIKKYDVLGFRNNKYNLLGCVICVVLTWLSKLCIDLCTYTIIGETKGGTYLIEFNSPIILLSGMFLLFFFSRLTLSKNISKIISFISSTTFGIYLLHEEPLIRETFIKGKFIECLKLPTFFMIITILGITLIIYIIGAFIDHIRLFLFDKLKVRMICEKIEKNLITCLERIIEKIRVKIHDI